MISMHTSLACSSRRSSRPLTQTTVSSAEQVGHLGHGPGEHPHLDRRHQVLQDEGGHQLAPLGVLADHPGDDAPDPAHLAVPGPLAQLGDGGVDVAGEGRLHPFERVVAQVEAEHLLLERQAHRLGELLVGDRDPGLVEDRLARRRPGRRTGS